MEKISDINIAVQEQVRSYLSSMVWEDADVVSVPGPVSSGVGSMMKSLTSTTREISGSIRRAGFNIGFGLAAGGFFILTGIVGGVILNAYCQKHDIFEWWEARQAAKAEASVQSSTQPAVMEGKKEQKAKVEDKKQNVEPGDTEKEQEDESTA
eukprot:m.11678 g.11678  ORF g.11678 m.11678 type:complete len:153 (-) comp5760_c0_seq1:199-657(-)